MDSVQLGRGVAIARHFGANAHSLIRRAAVGVWAIFVVGALGLLAAYSFTPGEASAPPRLGDVETPLSVDPDHFLLVMALHPKCPCSSASLGELTRIVTWHQVNLRTAFLVYQPSSVDADWAKTGLVAAARALPGSNVIVDVDGQFAARLGLNTSGTVALYSPRGDVEYWGGITMARAHSGDNIGSDAIDAILSGKTPLRRSSPVFGCLIHTSAQYSHSK